MEWMLVSVNPSMYLLLFKVQHKYHRSFQNKTWGTFLSYGQYFWDVNYALQIWEEFELSIWLFFSKWSFVSSIKNCGYVFDRNW